MSRNSSLSSFLSIARAQYLEDVANGRGKEWMVVMGNEAGDLDSVASSIAYAWCETHFRTNRTITLIRTKRGDLTLRPENLYALSLAGLRDSLDELLCIDDLVDAKPFPSDRFALVDHNRISSDFLCDNPTASVKAIIDHHEDEGYHKDSAHPRIIVPAGSCASLIALTQFTAQVPAELATLLLSAILIDTHGLKVGGKATADDREAACLLLSQTTFAASLPPVLLTRLHEDPKAQADNAHDIPIIHDLAVELSKKKESLAGLGTLDILRRDYKEWSLKLPSGIAIKVGLSSIPRPLEACDDLSRCARQWMVHQGLTIFGILSSFRDEHTLNKSGGPKHRREQAWIVMDAPESADQPALGLDLDKLAAKLWSGLEQSKELRLKPHPMMWVSQKEGRAKAYLQGNADATRKVVAPVMRSIIEGAEPPAKMLTKR